VWHLVTHQVPAMLRIEIDVATLANGVGIHLVDVDDVVGAAAAVVTDGEGPVPDGSVKGIPYTAD
jgi:hypothetical protein